MNFSEKLGSHQERKSEIIEKLRRKVEGVKSIILLYEKFNITGADADTTKDKLEEARQNILESFDEETMVQYNTYLKCQEELKQLGELLYPSNISSENTNQEELDGDEDFDGEEQLDNEAEEERFTDLEDKMDSLHTDDVEFIATIEALFTRLQKSLDQNKLLRSQKTRTEDKSVYLNEEGKIFCFSENDIIDVEETPFNTVFTIERKAWNEKYNPDSFACFQPGTSNIFFPSDNKGHSKNDTLRHESVHFMLDGISRYSAESPAQYIKDSFNRLNTMTLLGHGVQEIEDRIFSPLFIASILRHNIQNELLAHYDTARKVDFHKDDSMSLEERLLRSYFGDETPPKQFNYDTVLESLATAGEFIFEAHIVLRGIADRYENSGQPEYASKTRDLIARLEADVLKMASQLRELNPIGKILGPEIDLEIKSLLVLLEPAKYNHAKSYLEATYPSLVKLIDQNRKFFFNKIVSKQGFTDLLLSLKETANTPEETLEYIKDTILDSLKIPDTVDSEVAADELLEMYEILASIENEMQTKSPLNSLFEIKKQIVYKIISTPTSFSSIELIIKLFSNLPDNYFSDTQNSDDTNSFVETNVANNESKEKLAPHLKRLGLEFKASL